MRRALFVLTFLAFALPVRAEEVPAPFPVAERFAEASQAKQQADALVAELERELSLARFAAQQAMRSIEALAEIQQRDRDAVTKVAEETKPEPTKEPAP